MTPELAAKVKGLRHRHLRRAARSTSKDASLGDATAEGGASFTAPVDVTEWLGNEQYAYIPFEADPSVKAKLDELDRELDGEGMRTQLVVNLDARSRIREGDDTQLNFDPALMHVFDPNSGDCLTRDEAKADELAAGERGRPQAGAGAGPRPGGGAGRLTRDGGAGAPARRAGAPAPSGQRTRRVGIIWQLRACFEPHDRHGRDGFIADPSSPKQPHAGSRQSA